MMMLGPIGPSIIIVIGDRCQDMLTRPSGARQCEVCAEFRARRHEAEAAASIGCVQCFYGARQGKGLRIVVEGGRKRATRIEGTESAPACGVPYVCRDSIDAAGGMPPVT